MDYRDLETTGVLNEAGSGRGLRGSDWPAHRLPERGRVRKNPFDLRGKPIPRELCGLVPESIALARRISTSASIWPSFTEWAWT